MPELLVLALLVFPRSQHCGLGFGLGGLDIPSPLRHPSPACIIFCVLLDEKKATGSMAVAVGYYQTAKIFFSFLAPAWK
jgi:hypothetical protein